MFLKGSLKISVTDAGSGFSQEDLLHAEEQFYMSDCSRSSNLHFGMGLFITKSIVQQHSGQFILSNSEKNWRRTGHNLNSILTVWGGFEPPQTVDKVPGIRRGLSNLYEIFKIPIYDNHIRNHLPDDGKRKEPSLSRQPPYSKFTPSAADTLFAKQITMRPCTSQRQHQHIILCVINEQPVRENMTFPIAYPIAG